MTITFSRLLVLVGMALTTACMTSQPIAGAGETPKEGAPLGAFTVDSRVLGSSTLAPTICSAGDRQSFLGADLLTPGSPVVLRLVVDPLDGPALRLYSSEAQFDKTVVFRRADCAIFHFSLDSTGWRINDYEDYRLTLELDCSRDGESVKGAASSTHCH